MQFLCETESSSDTWCLAESAGDELPMSPSVPRHTFVASPPIDLLVWHMLSRTVTTGDTCYAGAAFWTVFVPQTARKCAYVQASLDDLARCIVQSMHGRCVDWTQVAGAKAAAMTAFQRCSPTSALSVAFAATLGLLCLLEGDWSEAHQHVNYGVVIAEEGRADPALWPVAREYYLKWAAEVPVHLMRAVWSHDCWQDQLMSSAWTLTRAKTSRTIVDAALTTTSEADGAGPWSSSPQAALLRYMRTRFDLTRHGHGHDTQVPNIDRCSMWDSGDHDVRPPDQSRLDHFDLTALLLERVLLFDLLARSTVTAGLRKHIGLQLWGALADSTSGDGRP